MAQQQQGGSQPGYDIGASFSGSASSAASLSGATDQGGSFNLGTQYGPGSLLYTTTDQRGSVGATTGAAGTPWLMLIGFAVAAIVFLKAVRI